MNIVSIHVPYKISPLQDNIISNLLDSVCDGGNGIPVNEWVGVGWAYSFIKNNKTIYVTAIQKNVPSEYFDEDGNMMESFNYNESNIVFYLKESNGQDSFFSKNEKILKEFIKDMKFNCKILKDETVQQGL